MCLGKVGFSFGSTKCTSPVLKLMSPTANLFALWPWQISYCTWYSLSNWPQTLQLLWLVNPMEMQNIFIYFLMQSLAHKSNFIRLGFNSMWPIYSIISSSALFIHVTFQVTKIKDYNCIPLKSSEGYVRVSGFNLWIVFVITVMRKDASLFIQRLQRRQA